MTYPELSSTVFRALKGVFCIYKPAGPSTFAALNTIRGNLCRDLNLLPVNESQKTWMGAEALHCTKSSSVTNMVLSSPLGNDSTSNVSLKPHDSLVFSQEQIERIQDHPLVLGKLWKSEDFAVAPVDHISSMMSGVLPIGIGRSGLRLIGELSRARLIRVYRVIGQFGCSTHDYTSSGRILERSNFKHVTQAKLDRVLAATQAAYHKQQYAMAGLPLHTQEAFEAASQGLIRPTLGHSPILYSVRCTNFRPPDFTLELYTINETGIFLKRLVHDLGIELKTGAVCTAMRRIRYGPLDTSFCLIHQQWSAKNIVSSIDETEPKVLEALTNAAEDLNKHRTSRLHADNTNGLLNRQSSSPHQST